MGASFTERTATGKSAGEAFGKALRDAQDYSGHQDGYSGDINSGDSSFVLVTLPPRFTYSKLQNLLEESESFGYDIESARERIRSWSPGGFYNSTGKKRGWKGQLAKARRDLAKAQRDEARFQAKVPAALRGSFEGYSDQYHDKWGGYLAVELRGAEARQYGANQRLRRGERLYIFFGYAPS